jgi:hypothetical protein
VPRLTITFTGLMLFVQNKNNDPVEVVFPSTDFGHYNDRHGHVHIPVLNVPPSSENPEYSSERRQLNGTPIQLWHWREGHLAIGTEALHGPVEVDDSVEDKPPKPRSTWTSFSYVPLLKDLYPDRSLLKPGEFRHSGFRLRLNGGRLRCARTADPRGDAAWHWLRHDNATLSSRYFTDVVVYELEHGGSKPLLLDLTGSTGRFNLGLQFDRDAECSIVCHPADVTRSAGYEIRHLGALARIAMEGGIDRDVVPFCPPTQCPSDPICPGARMMVAE